MENINSLLFWWSVVSTVIGITLLIGDVVLFVLNRKEKEHKEDQVKIWQQDANGVSQGLKRIVMDVNQGRYTAVKDVASAVWSLEASAFALQQSLYEERAMTEDEYKEQQKRIREEVMKTQQQMDGETKKT